MIWLKTADERTGMYMPDIEDKPNVMYTVLSFRDYFDMSHWLKAEKEAVSPPSSLPPARKVKDCPVYYLHRGKCYFRVRLMFGKIRSRAAGSS